MDSELSKKLKEIIKDEIKNFSIEKLKQKGKKKEGQEKKKAPSNYDRLKSSVDLDNTLFYGGGTADDYSKVQSRFIKEAEEPNPAEPLADPVTPTNQTNDPVITQTEIDQFEQDFRQKVTPLVKFAEKEDGTLNFELYNGESGVEAKVSGTIPLKAENKISWSFSLQNGAYIDANTELTQDVVTIISNLYFFYDAWKADWTEKLTEIPSADMGSTSDTQNS